MRNSRVSAPNRRYQNGKVQSNEIDLRAYSSGNGTAGAAETDSVGLAGVNAGSAAGGAAVGSANVSRDSLRMASTFLPSSSVTRGSSTTWCWPWGLLVMTMRSFIALIEIEMS